MIEVNKLGKKYGELEAVKSVSFKVNKGEIVGLLGPNGAGKTTIMKILTCYIFPTYGDALVNDFDIYEHTLQVKAAVGYLPENTPIYTDLNVLEYLNFIAQARSLEKGEKDKRIKWVIKECGLKEVIYRDISQLSKGYRQRVGIAQAILHDPEILILDEPTTGLDPKQIIEIRDLIKRMGKKKTVILSTHILQEVEATCERVLILNEGKIVARGTAAEIGREMKGETILDIVLKGKDFSHTKENIAACLGIRKVVKFTKLDDQSVNIHLACEAESNAQENVFDWAVKNKYKILSMIPSGMSLEDIFIKLTK